jgi:hypothetical protein
MNRAGAAAALSLMTYASAALGQAPGVSGQASGVIAAPASPAAPTAQAPKVVLDPREPWGLALRGGVDPSREFLHKEGGRKTPASMRAEWGTTLENLQVEMGDPSRVALLPDDKPLSCLPENSATTCFPDPSAPWYVDFGEHFQWAVRPYLTFAPDGRFFRYWATFAGEAFGEIRDALLARLGKPTIDKISRVHNMMGATFDQETIIWKRRHTTVELDKRSQGDLTKGFLASVYLPIAKTIASVPAAKAPM